MKIYGFTLDFPITDRIEFNPRFKRESGDLAVKSPTRDAVYLSWGELGKIVKKLPTPTEHATFSLERITNNVRGKLNKIEEKTVQTNGHMASYNHLKVEASKGVFGGGQQEQEVESLHVHCENTARYFVVYAMYSSNSSDRATRQETFRTIMQSLKCH